MDTKVETINVKLDIVKLVIALMIVLGSVVAFYIFADQSLLLRVLGLLTGTGIAVFVALQTEKGRSIWGFFQGAQIEVRKVVWPTRQETTQTTLIVIVMVIVVAFILWMLDLFLGWAVSSLLGQGS